MTAPPRRVLIVDDEPNLRRALAISLRASGYEIDAVGDGAAALRAVAVFKPDVVVLDLGLPDMDGSDVLATLRSWTSVPVLVLSARVGSQDKVRALDVGADDYVTKPFDVAELRARLRALFRRSETHEDAIPIPLGDYFVNVADRSITGPADREAPHLTRTEWELLTLMLRSAGRLLTHDALLRGLGRDPAFTDGSYLRLFVAQLRRKLEADHARPRHILTESGVGYRLVL